METVAHFLSIYKMRQQNFTSKSHLLPDYTQEFVDNLLLKLSKLPPKDNIKLEEVSEGVMTFTHVQSGKVLVKFDKAKNL